MQDLYFPSCLDIVQVTIKSISPTIFAVGFCEEMPYEMVQSYMEQKYSGTSLNGHSL